MVLTLALLLALCGSMTPELQVAEFSRVPGAVDHALHGDGGNRRFDRLPGCGKLCLQDMRGAALDFVLHGDVKARRDGIAAGQQAVEMVGEGFAQIDQVGQYAKFGYGVWTYGAPLPVATRADRLDPVAVAPLILVKSAEVDS